MLGSPLRRRPLGEPWGYVVSAIGCLLGLIVVAFVWLFELHPEYVKGAFGWLLRGPVIWLFILLGYGILVAIFWRCRKGGLTTAPVLFWTTFSFTLAVGLADFMVRYMVPELPPGPTFPETYETHLDAFIMHVSDSWLFAIATAGWVITLFKAIFAWSLGRGVQ